MVNETQEQHTAWGDALLWVTVVEGDGKATILGNAFIVTGFNDTVLALTARHVVDEIGRLAIKGSAFKGEYREVIAHPQFESHLHRVLGLRGSDGAVFEFGPFSTPDPRDFDVAACLLKAPDVERRSRFPLRFYPPDIGTDVMACGWSGFKKIHEKVEDLPAEWSVSGQRTTVSGKVVGSYMKKPGVTTGPCFEIEGHFPSGLSGSPVVCDVQGNPYACGVVSSSDETRAVVSMLWPALGLSVPADLDSGTASLYELARRGLLAVDPADLDRFKLDGTTIQFTG